MKIYCNIKYILFDIFFISLVIGLMRFGILGFELFSDPGIGDVPEIGQVAGQLDGAIGWAQDIEHDRLTGDHRGISCLAPYIKMPGGNSCVIDQAP